MENREFAERLSRLRTLKEMSARELSMNLGKNPSYINRIESGKTYPSMEEFFRICEALEVTPSRFFEVKEEDPYRYDLLLTSYDKMSRAKKSFLIEIAKGIVRLS